MTIAFDASSEATAGTSDPMEWTHSPVGTPKGVFVGIVRNQGSAQDEVSGVTYGGVSMARVPNTTADDKADDTANETGSSYIYFLGASIPTGDQTVSVNYTNATSTRWAACVTVTAGADTEVSHSAEYTPIEANTADPSITITPANSGKASYGAGILFSGLGVVGDVTGGTGYTKRQDHDFGNQVAAMISNTSEVAAGNDNVVAFTAATDDVAMCVAVIQETGAVSLAIADATHGHSADNIALTQHNVLAIADAAHGHTADNVVLVPNLIVQDAVHAHTADNLSLTQHNVLTIADSAHAHSADNLALTQHNVLAIQDALHGHTADNLALTQHNILVVADALHAHAADNLVLTAHEPGGSLQIQDAAHSHTADNLDLIQHYFLVIQDAAHGHAADNLNLVQHNILAIDDATHALGSDNLQDLGGELDEGSDFVRLRRRRSPIGTR